MTAQPTNTPADDAPYWDAALETQSRADWDAMKLELLKAHLQHAYNGSPYYRASFDTAGAHPDQVSSLDDLRRFPFIDKHALRDRQLAVPPLGDLVAVPERDVVYLSASSGSTGVPTASPFTAGDFGDWIDYEARQFWSSGLRPVDRYCHCLNFSLFIGGPCVLGAQKLGALGIHAGTLPFERLLLILRQFQATAMWTTPSYAWALGETAVAEGIDPRRDLAVRRIFVAGEPGGSIPETRARIEDLWGASVYDYYGLSDIFGSCAGMCEEKDGLHWAEDHILSSASLELCARSSSTVSRSRRSNRSTTRRYSPVWRSSPRTSASTSLGKMLTPLMMSMSSRRPCTPCMRIDVRPQRHGAEVNENDVAGAEPDHWPRRLAQGRQHQLSALAFGDGDERGGVEHLHQRSTRSLPRSESRSVSCAANAPGWCSA